MNKVVLNVNPDTGLNTISINGNPVSVYSELSNFMREPFSSWSDKLFDCLERELNDDFHLTVISGEEEGTMLKTLSEECESCIEFVHKKLAPNVNVSIAEVAEPIEVGAERVLMVTTDIEGAEIPEIRAVVMNGNVASCDGKKICGLAAGETDIEFYKGAELIPFSKIHVSVFKNNFIKRIELGTETNVIGIDTETPLQITVFPPDADDAKALKCTVDNPEILKVTSTGMIQGLKEGAAKITIKSKEAEASIEIEVLPDLKEVAIDCNSWNCFVGETKEISVSVEPERVYNSNCYWKTTDSYVAVVETREDGATVIRATGIGNCKLICMAEKGYAKAEIDISVDSTLNKPSHNHAYASLTIISSVIAMFIALGSSVISAVIACAVVIVFGLMTCSKHPWDSRTAKIFMVIPIVIELLDLFTPII